MSGEEMWKYCTGEQCRDLLRSLDLLRGTGVKQEQEIACLYSLANHAEAHYRRARIPKKNGGVRKLQIPDGMMKKVQRNLLHHVLDGLEPSPYATAYRKGAGLKENAAPHTGKRQILKLDLENFFENITFSLILENVFSSRLFPPAVGVLLTNLCCYRDYLPQGAPVSAAVSNLVMRPFDDYMGSWCGEQGIAYTRYCDDMTFSGDFDARKVKNKAQNFLKVMGFSLNAGKTRLYGQGHRQSVTGVVVNCHPQAARTYRKKLRQDLYYCEKYGVAGHLKRQGRDLGQEDAAGASFRYLQMLAGRAAFVLQVNPEDSWCREAKGRIARLQSELWV